MTRDSTPCNATFDTFDVPLLDGDDLTASENVRQNNMYLLVWRKHDDVRF